MALMAKIKEEGKNERMKINSWEMEGEEKGEEVKQEQQGSNF